MKLLKVIPLVALSCILFCCERRVDRAEKEQPPGSRSANSENFPPPIQSTSSEIEIEQSQLLTEKRISELSQIIKVNRDDDIWEASKAVRELLLKWNPVGKSSADLESILGTPTKRSPAELVYRLDDGFNGHMWTFKIEEGRVLKVVHESLD